MRKIDRTYPKVKEDVDRVNAGMKPLKPFVSRKDFLWWKQVVKKTDRCIKKTGDVQVSIEFSQFFR